jgi:hypothetical protein
MKDQFSILIQAQIGAMLGSLVVFTLIAIWYISPWLKQVSSSKAIVALLWIHVPRYVTLIMYSAQRDGYTISAVAAREAVIGDVAGALIALAAIAAFRWKPRWGISIAWLLVIETIADVIVGFIRKAHEPLWGKASGVNWLVLDFYIPLILVTLPLLTWKLFTVSRKQSPNKLLN